MRENDCRDSFKADAKSNFFPRTCCSTHKKYDKRSYLFMLDEAINLTSTIRGFRTINHMVATYEQTKKRLSYFYPKRQVQGDGIHTKPLNLKELIWCSKFAHDVVLYWFYDIKL